MDKLLKQSEIIITYENLFFQTELCLSIFNNTSRSQTYAHAYSNCYLRGYLVRKWLSCQGLDIKIYSSLMIINYICSHQLWSWFN